MEKAQEDFYKGLVDDIVLETILTFHRTVKLGYVCLSCSQGMDDGLEVEMVPHSAEEGNGKERDIFGLPPKEGGDVISCVRCHRNVGASRYAYHLEKCMGLGRSRGTRRTRPASYTGNYVDEKYESEEEEQEQEEVEEEEEEPVVRRKSTRMKRSRSEMPDSSTSAQYQEAVDYLRQAFPKDVLESQLEVCCGVVNVETHMMCDGGLMCQFHSEEERQRVRMLLLGDR